jgi:predicted AAA+ superfamily ATPase
MKRTLLPYLDNWISSQNRKPMVIRGARQVGKTWLVRHLAEKHNKELIELNLEKKSYASLLASNDPAEILLNLGAAANKAIDPQNSLLFLDEIQAAPELLAKLRWFAEDMPELAVIAAGSLLEFVLADHLFSMPVGRITYAHLEPFSFEEFVLACNKKPLYDYLQSYNLELNIPDAIHEQMLALFKEYILIGGMPAAVWSWSNERSLPKINQIQQDLLTTYRDDFVKYKGRMDKERFDDVLSAIPKMLGQKFVYSQVNAAVPSSTLKSVLGLLEKARVCNRVISSAANGIPLRAESDEKYFKVVFLDVGLCCASLGLGLTQINSVDEIDMINNGGIAEQIVGQLLRTIEEPYLEPALYYWRRDEKGSNAEIDYVMQQANQVVPIEVKAGATGKLKSLHLFMDLKQFKMAVRINSGLPSVTNVFVKNSAGSEISYKLISLPFYLVGQIHRLLGKGGTS